MECNTSRDIESDGPRLVRAVVAVVAVMVTVALMVIVTVVVAPAPAWAHAVLLGTAPADGSVVTELTTEVTLTFSEAVRADFSTIAVTGPEGGAYSDGDLSVRDNVVRQPVHPLRSGDYQVAWRIVSADGHPVSGTFAFSVAMPPGQEPSAPPPAAPNATEATGSRGAIWWWASAAAALVVVALLLARATRRRRVP